MTILHSIQTAARTCLDRQPRYGRARRRVNDTIRRVICLFLTGIAATASADAGVCTSDVTRWLDACAVKHPMVVAAQRCEGGRLRVELTTDAGPLAVEAVPDVRGLRHVGDFGLSPIVDVADWEAQPIGPRTAFAHFAACFSDSAPPRFESLPQPKQPVVEVKPPRPAAPELPTLLLLGTLLALALSGGALVRALRRVPLTTLALAILVPLATFLARRAVFPLAFLHQNGHGPFWVRNALWPLSVDGPGYRQLFSWSVVGQPEAPEAALFLLQGAFAAWQPTFAWLIARSAGASRSVAFAALTLVAVDPTLGRLSGSESYLSAAVSLLFGAGAILAVVPVGEGRAQLAQRVLGYVAAGLVVAEVALTHPLGWLPAACLPLIVFWREPSVGRRWRESSLAACVIGVVVVLTAGEVLYTQATHPDHAKFQVDLTTRAIDAIPFTALFASLLAVWWLRSLVVVLPLATLLLFVTQLQPTVVVPYVVHEALLAPFAPVWVAGVAALAHRLPPLPRLPPSIVRHGQGVVLLVLGLACMGARWQRVLELPTDIREAQESLGWRAALGATDGVISLENVNGETLLPLPLYPGVPGQPSQLVTLQSAVQRTHFGPSIRRAFYYRSSLCATPRGAPLCAEFEQRVKLQPRWHATLPAVASVAGVTYLTPSIDVGLFELPAPDAW